MMKVKSVVLVLIILCAPMALRSGSGRADENDKKPGEGSEAAARVLEIMAEANTLAEFGKKNKSPFALVTAGGLLLRLEGLEARIVDHDEPTEVEYEPGAEKGEEPKEQPKLVPFKKQANDLFDEARGVVADATDVEKLIKLARGTKPADLLLGEPLARGAKGGPKSIRKTLARKASHSTTIPFVVGKQAVVTFRSNGPCHVFVVRTDNAYVHTASDTTATNAVWVPAPNSAPPKGRSKGKTKGKAPAHKAGATHNYLIKVSNRDKKPVQYTIITN